MHKNRSRGLRITTEGLVWEVLAKAIRLNNFELSVREVANRVGRAASGVAATMAWHIYTKGRGQLADENRRMISERTSWRKRN